MKIAIDASSLLTAHPRGEGRSLLRLYEEIARIRPEWKFVFIGERMSASANDIQDRVPRSEIRTLDLPGYRWNLWEEIALPYLAWRSGANLLHCASSGSPRWSPIPLILTVHDVIPLLMDDGLSPEDVDRFRARLSAGVRQGRRIIAVSDCTRKDLAQQMALDAKKVDVVYWGADSVPQQPDTKDLKRNIILAFGGGGAKRKNTPALIRAFERIHRTDSQARLVVLGVSDAQQRAQLQNLVDELSLSDRVDLKRYVSDAEMANFFRDAVCLVYISLYEGFGLPPLEAMAKGLPVVASDRSSIPEVVGDAGLLVDPDNIDEIAEATLKLIQNTELREDLSIRAWKRAQQFSWRTTAEQTASVFESTGLT